MKTMLHPDMIEATRLTREGRLTEATTLLQRMFGRGGVPDGTTDAPPTDDDVRSLAPAPVIQVTPDMIELPARRHPARTGEAGANLDREPADTSEGFGTSISGRIRGFLDQFHMPGAAGPSVGRSAERPPATAPRTAPSAAGQFLTATFADNNGTRDYKLYVPGTYRGQPLPLIIMLHGCTQSADDFAAGTRMNMVAEDHACLVAYPVQPPSANGQKCWNWFKPGDQKRDHGEPALIAGITRQIMRDYAVDPRRVYVGGLSAGGAAAAIMGATYPDLYAAVGVHSGLACGAASDVQTAFSAMRQGTAGASDRSRRSFGFHGRDRMVPTIVFHGEKDGTVHPRNGDHVIEQSRATGPGDLRPVTQHGHVPGGRSYSRTSHFDPSGRSMLELWVVHGAGHAWSGGSGAGSFTDPRGPDASREMVRFFLEHPHPHPSAALHGA